MGVARLVFRLVVGSQDFRERIGRRSSTHGVEVKVSGLGQRPKPRGCVEVGGLYDRRHVDKLDLQQGPQREPLLGEPPLVGERAERERAVLHIPPGGQGQSYEPLATKTTKETP